MKLYVIPTEEGAARAQVHGAREATTMTTRHQAAG